MENNLDFLMEEAHLNDTLNIINEEILSYIEKRKYITEYIIDYRKKVIEEYYKESNLKDKEIVTLTNYVEKSKLRNSELGIFQNSFELVHLRKQLEDIIDKIINAQEIDVESYL